MKQVGVLRKQIEGAELVQTGGGSPQLQLRMPLGGGSSKKPQMPLRGGRDFTEMRDAQDRARSAASKIAELEGGRKTIGEMEGMSPRDFDQHMRRTDLDIGVLKPRVEAAQPQTYEEKYGLEASQRAQPGQEATAYSRGGLGGTTGRALGAGLAGAYGGLQALLALNRAGASGQDAVSALGGSALQGMTSYGTVAPTAQNVGGEVGSRVGVRGGRALDERRAARDERSARRGASQFLGQFDPNLNFNQRPAEPTVQTYPGQTPFAHTPVSDFQRRLVGNKAEARAHHNRFLTQQDLPPLKPMMTPLANAPPVAVAAPTAPQPAAPVSGDPNKITNWGQGTKNLTEEQKLLIQNQTEGIHNAMQNSPYAGQSGNYSHQNGKITPLGNLTEQATGKQNAAGASSSTVSKPHGA